MSIYARGAASCLMRRQFFAKAMAYMQRDMDAIAAGVLPGVVLKREKSKRMPIA